MISKSVYIEITNRCNLNCRDCYNSSGTNKNTVELDPDTLINFIKELKYHCGVEFVVISGGEPLLHSRFNEILESISEFSKENTDVDFNFITNGTTYNPLFYSMLENNPHFTLQVSLDGPNEAANASMRGAGNFQRVVSNLSKRKFARKPVFKMIINKANAPFVEEYFYFVQDVFDGMPAYAFVNYQGNAVENWSEMAFSAKEQADIIVKIHNLYKKHNITSQTLPMPASHCDLTESDGVRNFCVKSDGSVQPCQNLYDNRFTLANIHSLDWEDLERKIGELSSNLSKRLSIDYGCGVCPIKSKCGRGCAAVAFASKCDIMSDDGYCELRRMSTFRLIKAVKIKNE